MTDDAPVHAADLAAYLARIGYTGTPTPTLDTLRGIQAGHTHAIAFENLSPWLRQPVPLDLPALIAKLVRGGRGGYCFEQNLLLRAMLLALGFEVTALAARVRWNRPAGVQVPRTHMLLRVVVDGQPYLVDAGFGGLTLTTPLLLAPGLEQPTPHEPCRLVADGDTYHLQALLGQEWQALYSFDLQEQQVPDYDVTSWYLSNHPESHFVTTLIAARPDAGRRSTLRNNVFAIQHCDGRREQRTLTTVAELRAILEGVFLLALPDSPELELALARVAAIPPA
jgi:N-hydroxyarylamine O-acetyltransferase